MDSHIPWEIATIYGDKSNGSKHSVCAGNMTFFPRSVMEDCLLGKTALQHATFSSWNSNIWSQHWVSPIDLHPVEPEALHRGSVAAVTLRCL